MSSPSEGTSSAPTGAPGGVQEVEELDRMEDGGGPGSLSEVHAHLLSTESVELQVVHAAP